jgi:hypothetical protein
MERKKKYVKKNEKQPIRKKKEVRPKTNKKHKN